jgi:hypothetical protein
MANEKPRKFMFRNVEFKYPRLNQTYRYNTAEKRSEPCQPTASNAAYSVAWEMSQADAKPIYAEMKAYYESRKSSPAFSKIFGMKKLENGNIEFRAKHNGTNSQGSINTPPTVIDGNQKPLADAGFWGGSKGSIRVRAVPSTDPDGLGGISLWIDVVQVTHAIYGGDNFDDFETTATTIVGAGSELDAFDAAVKAPAPADDPFAAPSKPAPASVLDDSEIPF